MNSYNLLIPLVGENMRSNLTAYLETKETKLQLLLRQSAVKDKVRQHISSTKGSESLNGAKICVLIIRQRPDST